MAGETTITIIGNLTAEPEMRTTSKGGTVCNFSIAATPRQYNSQSGQWEDGQALFMRCTVWRDMAEHCAQTLHKGMRVIAQGRLTQRSYQAQDGSNRTVIELQVDEIGPSLKYATAQVARTQHAGGQSNGYSAAKNIAEISQAHPYQNNGFSNANPFGGAAPASQPANNGQLPPSDRGAMRDNPTISDSSTKETKTSDAQQPRHLQHVRIHHAESRHVAQVAARLPQQGRSRKRHGRPMARQILPVGRRPETTIPMGANASDIPGR